MRLIVARCQVSYTGRATAVLPDATRLLMIKADGTVMVWSDADGYKVKPLNYAFQTPRMDEHPKTPISVPGGPRS